MAERRGLSSAILIVWAKKQRVALVLIGGLDGGNSQAAEGLHVPGLLVGGMALCPGPGSYLVDPASSHMLVSKIKPCMSEYKLSHSETANG